MGPENTDETGSTNETGTGSVTKRKEKAPSTKKPPEVDVRAFLDKCGGTSRESVMLCEKFRAVARQYGRKVSVNGNRVIHDIPNDQLKWIVALVK